MAILTLTGELGSGRKVIGEALAAALGYQYVSRGALMAGLGDLGNQWAEWGRELDVHCPTIWERYDWSYMAFKAQVQTIYLTHALQDKVILMGRGGNFLLRDVPYALCVRLTAPRDIRVERIMKKDEVSRQAAELLVDRTDDDSACYIRALYGKQWDAPGEYDTMLDTGTQSVDAVVTKIKGAVEGKERFNTEEARTNLRATAEIAKVKAALITNPQTFVPTLDVLPADRGGILVRGVVHSEAQRKKIEQAARALAGTTAVTFELHYR